MGSIDIRIIVPQDLGLKEFVALNAGVHLYRISIDNTLYRLATFNALLSPDEHFKADRYLKQQDRDRFTVGRGALREILASYMGISATAIQFGAGINKKPFAIADPQLCFSISYSSDWVLIAVSNKDVGVDIEFIDSDFSSNEVVHEYFSSAELNYLDSQNMDTAFYTLWTRKEAFLKGTGQGIGDHLKFTPSLDGIHQLDPQLDGSDRNWKVFSFMLNPHYVCAVASESEAVSFMEYPF